VEQSRIDYQAIRRHYELKNRKAAPMLVTAAETFYAFRELCRRSPTLSETDAGNLETLFCIAEAMQESGVDSVRLDDVDVEMKFLIQQIQLWLWKVYQQAPWRNHTRPAYTERARDLY